MGGEENNLLDGSSNPPLAPQSYPPQNSYPSPTYQQQNQSYAAQPYQSNSPQYAAPPQHYAGAPGGPGYGYDYQGAPMAGEAVIVGVAPIPGEKHHGAMLHEHFGDQVKNFPARAISAIIKPHVHHYDHLKLAASWPIVLLVLFIQMIFGIIFAVINYEIAMAAYNRAKDAAANAGSPWDSSSAEAALGLAIGVSIGISIISTLAMFFISNGVCHGVSLCLGGGKNNGQTSSNMFLQLCFLVVVYGLPLDLIGGILGLIPVVGAFISLAVAIYRLVLFVISLRAVYDITTCHAIGVIVVWIIVLVVFVLLLWLAFAASFLAVASALIQ